MTPQAWIDELALETATKVLPSDAVNRVQRVAKLQLAIVAEIERAIAAPGGETCTCPEHGSWIAAEDINRMVKEISVAMYGDKGARAPLLCDIVVDVVRLAKAARKAPAGDWQSMASAPRDGSVVMLRFGEDGQSPGWYLDGKDFPWVFIDKGALGEQRHYGSAFFFNRMADGEYGPTHWRPYDHDTGKLLAITAAIGLREVMHGIRATEAKQLLVAFLYVVEQELFRG